MKALIIGQAAPGALADSYSRAFRALGWKVERYCEARAWRDMLPGADSRLAHRALSRFLAPIFNRWIRKDLQRRVDDADLVLVIKGRHFSQRTVKWLRTQFRAPVLNFYPDDPFSSRRSVQPTYGPEALIAYDRCFTFARHLIGAYRTAGVRSVSYLPFARDPHLHAPVERSKASEFDLVFVGNCDAAERIRWLEAVACYRLAIFGEENQRRISRQSPLRQACFFGPAYGREMALALRRGKISLNLMRRQNRLSHNMRSFESPACGAFTLSQRTPELVRLFREGLEIVCFGDVGELRAQVDFWLSHEWNRERVARRGYQRVKDDTYSERVGVILQAAGFVT